LEELLELDELVEPPELELDDDERELDDPDDEEELEDPDDDEEALDELDEDELDEEALDELDALDDDEEEPTVPPADEAPVPRTGPGSVGDDPQAATTPAAIATPPCDSITMSPAD
jgi:hypothetical protein